MTAFVSRAMMASGSKPGEGPYGERLSKSLAYLLGRVQDSGLIHFQGRQRAGAHVRPRLRPDVPGRVPEGGAQGRNQGEDRAGGASSSSSRRTRKAAGAIFPSRATPIFP